MERAGTSFFHMTQQASGLLLPILIFFKRKIQLALYNLNLDIGTTRTHTQEKNWGRGEVDPPPLEGGGGEMRGGEGG